MPLASALAPFAHRQFSWLCAGTVISALGTWVQSTASAWVMTDLTTDVLMVSLTQAAAQLPVLLLVIPGGTLADLIDRRRYLILTNAWMFAMSALLGILYAASLVGPWILLTLTTLLAAGAALNAPAWSSSVALTVPRDTLSQAIVLNSMGFNLSRAIGPALGGVLVTVAGAALAFIVNAASFAMVAAICTMALTFASAHDPARALPPEPKGRALLLGLRYVSAEPHVRAALVRSLAFYGMASAMWALLPLYVRQTLGLSAAGYGAMLGATGAGAVLSGAAMSFFGRHLSRDTQVMAGGLMTGAILIPMALFPSAVLAGCFMVVFGSGWILAASNLLAAVQMASAPWVRARGVAVYQAIFSGAMGIGAIVWGWLAETAGLPGAILAAGLGGAAIAFLSRAYPLSDDIVDPSLPPAVAPPVIIAHDLMLPVLQSLRHPVVVTIKYIVDAKDADLFHAAMIGVAASRRRDGATAWILARDVEQPDIWLEAFRLPDWLELHRGLARVNLVDAAAIGIARSFHRADRTPEVRVLAIEQG